MRPDKKKVRRHDGTKHEAAAKQKAAQKTKGQKTEPERENTSLKGHYDQGSEEVDPKYAKRAVVSNWTKFEIPLDDSEDETADRIAMTGDDFNDVLQKASKLEVCSESFMSRPVTVDAYSCLPLRSGGADALFQTKAEREWSQTATMFTNEFFSINLGQLEKKISAIPLYKQIGLKDSEIDVSHSGKSVNNELVPLFFLPLIFYLSISFLLSGIRIRQESTWTTLPKGIKSK